jgi:ubiquitin-activating enzyme E1
MAAANLHAFNYGLRGEGDPNVYKKYASSIQVPKFTPKSGVQVQVNDNEPVPEAGGGGLKSINQSINPLMSDLCR